MIIANAETHEPIDVLPNRRLQTIKTYLQTYGQDVEIVVMDMSNSFRAAVQQALGKPVITANPFHYCRYVYWALDDIRKKYKRNGMRMIARNVSECNIFYIKIRPN